MHCRARGCPPARATSRSRAMAWSRSRPSARYGSVNRIFTVWFTPNLVPAAFFIGTLVDARLPASSASGPRSLAVVVGNLVGSYFVALLSTMGPQARAGPDAGRPAAVRQVDRGARAAELVQHHRLGRHQQRLRRRGADAADPRPAVHRGPDRDRALPGRARHLRPRGDPHLREVGRDRAGRDVRGPDRRRSSARRDTSFTDGFTGADQIGAFIGMVAIVASFVLAWSLYASDYSRYLPENTSTSKVFWYTLRRHGPGLGLARGARRAGGDQPGGSRRRVERHDLRPAGRQRRHHGQPGHGRHLHRHHRRQRHERLHRVALAAGGRASR